MEADMPIKKLQKSDDNIHMIMMMRVHAITQREIAERKKNHEPAAAFFTMIADMASRYANSLLAGEIMTVAVEQWGQTDFLEEFGFDPGEIVEFPRDDGDPDTYVQ